MVNEYRQIWSDDKRRQVMSIRKFSRLLSEWALWGNKYWGDDMFGLRESKEACDRWRRQ